MIRFVFALALVGCESVELPEVVWSPEESEPLQVRREWAENSTGGYVVAHCPPKTVLIGGGCICHLGQLYASAMHIEDNTREKVWECGCNPIPNYPYGESPWTLGVTAQAFCLGPAPGEVE